MSMRPNLLYVCGVEIELNKKHEIVDSRWKKQPGRFHENWTSLMEQHPAMIDTTGYDRIAFDKHMDALIYNGALVKNNERLAWHDLIEFDPEFSSNVLGYKIDHIRPRDALYALAATFLDQWEDAFCMELPTQTPPDDWRGGARYYQTFIANNYLGYGLEKIKWLCEQDSHFQYKIKQAVKYYYAIKNRQNPHYFTYAESDVTTAHMLLNRLGLKVDKSELKFYLIWKWC